MIGLLDYDYSSSTSTNLLIPNIEIMKLATYYKIEENQFCRLLSLKEEELTNYDKIYFFSELSVNPIIPDNFLRAKNVVYGGTAFTNDKYIPFENEIIDFTIPRPTIYKDSLKQKYNDGIKSKVISHVLDDSYYRNYAGENRLPLPAIQPKKRIFLYDREFFYNDWEYTIKTISARKPSSIVRIHPIICKTLTEFFTMRNYPKISRENEVILDIEIPLEEVNYMFKYYKNLFLADITPNSNVYLNVGGSWSTNLQYIRDLMYKLNLLYSFWARGIFIKLKYQSPKIGYHNPIENITQLIVLWSNGIKNNAHSGRDVTINDRIPKKKKNNLALDEKELIIKDFPSAETLFLQSFNILSKERRWMI